MAFLGHTTTNHLRPSHCQTNRALCRLHMQHKRIVPNRGCAGRGGNQRNARPLKSVLDGLDLVSIATHDSPPRPDVIPDHDVPRTLRSLELAAPAHIKQRIARHPIRASAHGTRPDTDGRQPAIKGQASPIPRSATASPRARRHHPIAWSSAR
jgi:hypothetical protein